MACATAKGVRSLFMNARSVSRAGSPSYLALHHAGFSVPPVSPPERWALTHLFTLAKRSEHLEDVSQVSLCDATALHSAGGLILCGTFRSAASGPGFRRCSPLRPWRYQARCPVKSSAPHNLKSVPQDGVRTFLPPSFVTAALRRHSSAEAGDHPAARHLHYTSENAGSLYLFPAKMKPTIRPMRVREAKDFLVAQAAEQAA